MHRVILLALLLGSIGCSRDFGERSADRDEAQDRGPRIAVQNLQGRNAGQDEPVGLVLAKAEGNLEAEPAQQVAASKRKIIYMATVSLVVENFSTVATDLSELIERRGGYVAESHVDKTGGQQRAGRWIVRIPVESFDAFLKALGELGFAETVQTNAQDVTEEYVDLQARIANSRRLEERILSLLENRDGDIKDVITVEKELSRVREEIERMEGRLRYMVNRTALTTVTISVREQRDYVPPQAPTFTARIAQSWGGSLSLLRLVGEATVLVVVALVPWLSGVILLSLPVLWFRRRRSQRLTTTMVH